MVRKGKKNKKGRICGVYIRCSTKDQEIEGQSLKYQAEECKKYMEEHNLAHMKTYQDVISGSTRYSKRPGISKMFEDIEEGIIDAVVVHALDRLCRDLDASGEINCFLKDHKITLYECRSNSDATTFQGRSQINMERFMGQMELDLIKERTRSGMESKKKRVGWIGGRVPFGYIKPDDLKDSIPIINPEEAETVKLIYKLYWDDKITLSGVTKHLNENKIQTGQYNKNFIWRNSGVIRILTVHRLKYTGGLINDNMNNIRWDKILEDKYNETIYPR